MVAGTFDVAQIAYATSDLRSAVRHWYKVYGAGPFFVREHVPTVRVLVEGHDAAVFQHSRAIGQWGTVMVELVEHHDLRPASLERDMRRGASGIHHVGCLVDNLDEARDRMVEGGARVVMDAQTATARFVFMDPGPEVGHLVELYERTPSMVDLYRMVRQASEGWDGTDLIREQI